MRGIPVLAMGFPLLGPSASLAQAYFQRLEFLEGFHNGAAYAISADGTTVVGSVNGEGPDGITQAFRWRADTGMIGLGDLPGGEFRTDAVGVSADGSVVVGYGQSDLFVEGWRWTQSTGMQGFGDLPGGIAQSYAFAVSADGERIVGMSYSDSGNEAVIWDRLGGGVVAQRGNMVPFAMSGNGNVAVGDWIGPNGGEACLWEWPEGFGSFVPLGDLPGGAFYSTAHAVSFDGAIVVGHSSHGQYNDGFRWTSRCGMTALGLDRAYITATSANGSVIVGWADFGGNDDEPFVWDSVRGTQTLQSILLAATVDLGGYVPLRITGVSGDGQTLCGTARHPNGINDSPFIARVPFRCNVADIDFNGAVDIADLAELLSRFGSCCGQSRYLLATDLTGEGCIDLDDLSLLLAQFGTICQ